MGNMVEKLRKIEDINDLDACANGIEIFLNGELNNFNVKENAFIGGQFNGRFGVNLHLTNCSRYPISINFDYKSPDALKILREMRDNATKKYIDEKIILSFPINNLDIYVIDGKRAPK